MIKMAFQKGHSDNSEESRLKGPDCRGQEAAAQNRVKAGAGRSGEYVHGGADQV